VLPLLLLLLLLLLLPLSLLLVHRGVLQGNADG
jgi:hypothetical protein